MAATATGATKISAQAEEVLLDFAISERLWQTDEDEREEQGAARGVEWDVADLIDDERRIPPNPLELGFQPAVWQLPDGRCGLRQGVRCGLVGQFDRDEDLTLM
jgi:hypothetical protein